MLVDALAQFSPESALFEMSSNSANAFPAISSAVRDFPSSPASLSFRAFSFLFSARSRASPSDSPMLAAVPAEHASVPCCCCLGPRPTGYSRPRVRDPPRPKNTYVRGDQVLPHLAALAILLAGDAGQDAGNRALAQLTGPDCTAAMIDRLRAGGTVLTYDPDEKTVRAGDHDAPAVVIAEDRQHRASERRTA